MRPLFTATGPDGSPQPITASVALAQEPGVGLSGRVFVLFGTGSYITNGDLTDTRVQSIYAVIDEDGPNSVAALDRGDLQKRTIPIVGHDALGRSARAWEPFSELDETKKGWFVDLDEPHIGERVVSTPVIRGRALWFASIIPEMGQGCDVGGTGYLNALDVFTGTNPGRADGSSYSFIDVNRDGEGDDYLDGYADGDIGLVTSVDLGIGMPSVPSFIGDDAYSQGSDARLGRLSGIASGARPQRLRWHELVGQE